MDRLDWMQGGADAYIVVVRCDGAGRGLQSITAGTTSVSLRCTIGTIVRVPVHGGPWGEGELRYASLVAYSSLHGKYHQPLSSAVEWWSASRS